MMSKHQHQEPIYPKDINDNNLSNKSGTGNFYHNATTRSLWHDPQFMLKAMAFDQCLQSLDIVDFVQHVNKSSQEEQQVVSTVDNETNMLILHSGPAKPNLESLTITQWPIQMLEYLSSTMSIWRFSCTCEGVSVLFFDREYRKLKYPAVSQISLKNLLQAILDL